MLVLDSFIAYYFINCNNTGFQFLYFWFLDETMKTLDFSLPLTSWNIDACLSRNRAQVRSCNSGMENDSFTNRQGKFAVFVARLYNFLHGETDSRRWLSLFSVAAVAAFLNLNVILHINRKRLNISRQNETEVAGLWCSILFWSCSTGIPIVQSLVALLSGTPVWCCGFSPRTVRIWLSFSLHFCSVLPICLARLP